jgi:hypothetical protein
MRAKVLRPLEYPFLSCLIKPLFEGATIGRNFTAVLRRRGIDAPLMPPLGEFLQAEPFTEGAFVSNRLQRLAGESMADPRLLLACRRRCRHSVSTPVGAVSAQW